MSIEQILAAVRSFDGALVIASEEGSGFPEIAWGDFFFYYAPDGQVPRHGQPYGTIVTKDYPGDSWSDLNGDGRWRLNIHVGRTTFRELTGESTRKFASRDFAMTDVVMPHPVYGALGWVAVVNPGEKTMNTMVDLLRGAHDDAKARAERRVTAAEAGDSDSGMGEPRNR